MAWSYREALEAFDVEAMIEHFADDVVLHSPLTAHDFVGADEVEALYRALFTSLDGAEVTGEFGEGDDRVLFLSARLGGGEVHLAERFRLDADGRIREITLYGRPIHGTALFAKVLGPQLAERHHGTGRGRFVRAVTAPLPAALQALDRVGAKLSR
jgi:hypothetical protein